MTQGSGYGLPRPFPFRGPPPAPLAPNRPSMSFPFGAPPTLSPTPVPTNNTSRLPPTAPLQNPFHSSAEFLRNNEGQRQNERNTNLNEQNQRNLAFTTRPQVSWYR